MSEIPDLWGPGFELDVLNPAMILNVQSEKIKHRSRGLLIGELTGRERGDFLSILFDILAPAAHNLRQRLMVVRHHVDHVYPAIITSKAFDSHENAGCVPLGFNIPPNEAKLSMTAHTQEDFIRLVGTALGSPYTQSVIQSLIARSNELTRGIQTNFLIQRFDANGDNEDLLKLD